MSIASISVFNFRSHGQFQAGLGDNINLISGKNGSGKTSLIEAIYIALQGSSFRSSDSEILKSGQDWYRIELEFSDGIKRVVTFDPAKKIGKKQFLINQKINYRLPAKDRFPIVLFEPDDLRLLGGSPVRRRQFIDRLIGQLDIRFHQATLKYGRALRQRNNLLKRPGVNSDELFVWNITLSEYGAYIISERIAVIEKINQQLSGIYSSIAGSENELTIHYKHTLIGDIKQKLLRELSEKTDKDQILGYTSVGPHRHDFVVEINGQTASTTASRGENRSIVLALKYIEVDLIESLTGQKPLILLDDVFSELDDDRQKNLVGRSNQTIITSVGVVDDRKLNLIKLT